MQYYMIMSLWHSNDVTWQPVFCKSLGHAMRKSVYIKQVTIFSIGAINVRNAKLKSFITKSIRKLVVPLRVDSFIFDGFDKVSLEPSRRFGHIFAFQGMTRFYQFYWRNLENGMRLLKIVVVIWKWITKNMKTSASWGKILLLSCFIFHKTHVIVLL